MSADAYKAAYNTPPENAFAAFGYDSVRLVADAITRAGSTDPAKIRDALAATQGYKGITGSISYAADSRVPQRRCPSSGSRTTSCTLPPK